MRAFGPWQGRVRRLVPGSIRFERGSIASVDAPRIAVLAHWSDRPLATRSVCALVHELQAAAYRVVVSSACDAPSDLVWDAQVDVDQLVVIRKPNVGYDFGSWSVALDVMPAIATAEQVILLNDSMAGPFASLHPLLQRFHDTEVDVWGLTSSQQFEPHLQSYFLGFRGGLLGMKPLRTFWSNVRDEQEKIRIIFRNELGLSRLLREEGYLINAEYAHRRYVDTGENPVIVRWRELLEDGFPFLKREILRDPAVAPDGESALSTVRSLYGVDVADWVDDLNSAEGPAVKSL